MIGHRNEPNFCLYSSTITFKSQKKDILDKGQDNSRPQARKVSVEALNVAGYDGMWSIKLGNEPHRWPEQSIKDFLRSTKTGLLEDPFDSVEKIVRTSYADHNCKDCLGLDRIRRSLLSVYGHVHWRVVKIECIIHNLVGQEGSDVGRTDVQDGRGYKWFRWSFG